MPQLQKPRVSKNAIEGLAFEPYKETGRVFLLGRDRKIRPITWGQLQTAITLEPLGEGNLDIHKYDY